jgi:hypothetical protein
MLIEIAITTAFDGAAKRHIALTGGQIRIRANTFATSDLTCGIAAARMLKITP